MSRLEELEYLFATEDGDLDQHSLIELVTLLQEQNSRLMSTLEDVSKQQDQEINSRPDKYDDMD